MAGPLRWDTRVLAAGDWLREREVPSRCPGFLLRPSLAIDSMSKRLAIILAAGKGTRMKSDLPKVLCPVRGRPMVEFVLDALRRAGVEHLLVVVGYRSDLVRQTLGKYPRRGVRGAD